MAKSNPVTSTRRRRRAPSREILEVLSENMRTLRAKQRLSQDELAARAGLDRSYIGDVERCEHNPTVGTLEALAAGLGVSVIDLLSVGPKAPRKRHV